MAGFLAFDKAHQDAVGRIGQTVVEGQSHRAVLAGRLPGKPLIAPERPFVERHALDHAALWLALQELVAPARQQGLDLQAQQHRRRDGEDHPARTEAVGIGEQLHAVIVLHHTTDRLPAAHGIAQTLGQTQADQL